eukprot:jgi/Undpi1/13854/HiC_scaffold_9.g03505.m1
MFGRFVPSDMNEHVHIFDEHGESRKATGTAQTEVLLGANNRKEGDEPEEEGWIKHPAPRAHRLPPLASLSRNSAVWPAADGTLMFGRFVPSDMNEHVHIFDEHGESRKATGTAQTEVLLGANNRKVRKAMSLRRIGLLSSGSSPSSACGN